MHCFFAGLGFFRRYFVVFGAGTEAVVNGTLESASALRFWHSDDVYATDRHRETPIATEVKQKRTSLLQISPSVRIQPKSRV